MKQISQENIMLVLTEHQLKNFKVEKVTRGLYSIEVKNTSAETIKEWAEASFRTAVTVVTLKKNVYELLFEDPTLDNSLTEAEKKKEELIKKIMGGSSYSDDPRINWTLSQNR
jgi:hypothetical protein